mmetsp:Transcript_2487/g.3772  ORF Transcript_2487/g.3772 Transcript_2487/m.3772 type:complete len:169 (+) Transcript_2487:1491-1997(+)
MSDIILINFIIQTLEERRYTAQTEIRLLTQRIQRLQNARGLIAEQVRQQSIRRATYNTYQGENNEEGNQVHQDQQAPEFFHQDTQVNQEAQGHEADENTLPDLTQAEQDFIEECGHEETSRPRHRVQPQARRTRNRPPRGNLPTNRPRNLEAERRIHLVRNVPSKKKS